MKAEVYSNGMKKTAVLLHGGGLAPWSMRKLAGRIAPLADVYIPFLPGHAGSGLPFTTIDGSAEDIISFIDEKLGGHADLIAGLSLGAQILLSVLSKRPGITDSAIIESANVCPTLTPACILKSSVRMSYPLTKKEWFAKAQFRSLNLDPELFEDYFRDTKEIEKDDMVNFLASSVKYRMPDGLYKVRAKVHVICGEKEPRTVLKSAVRIHDAIPGSDFTVIPGLHHGEASMKLHYSYLEAVRELLAR